MAEGVEVEVGPDLELERRKPPRTHVVHARLKDSLGNRVPVPTFRLTTLGVCTPMGHS